MDAAGGLAHGEAGAVGVEAFAETVRGLMQASALEGSGPGSLVNRTDGQRGGNLPTTLIGIYPTKDGVISLAAMQRQVASVLDCSSEV